MLGPATTVFWVLSVLGTPPDPAVPSTVPAGKTGELSKPGVIVCVADFVNLKPHADFDYLGPAIAEGLSSRLAGMQVCKMVERSRLQEVQKELKLRMTDLVDERTVAEIGKILGASHMIVGTYRVELFPEHRMINVRLVEVQTTAVVWGNQYEGRNQSDVQRMTMEGLLPQLPAEYVDPGDAYRKALAMLGEGKAAEAFPLLWDAVERSPQDPVLHRTVADCAREANMAAELLKRYRALAPRHPRSAVVQNYLGNALLMVDPNDTAGTAAAAYQRALELDPTFAPPINNIAIIRLHHGDYQVALNGFQAYVEKSPQDPFGWMNVGSACVHMLRGKRPPLDPSLRRQAETAYLQSLTLDPGVAGAHRGLGALYELGGERDKAIQAYRASLKLDRHQKDLSERLAELEPGGEEQTKDAPVTLPERLRSRETQERFDQAVLAAQYAQARWLKEQSKLGAAIEQYDWALKGDPRNALGWLMKADLCLRAGLHERAAEALQRAVEIRPAVRDTPLCRELVEKLKKN